MGGPPTKIMKQSPTLAVVTQAEPYSLSIKNKLREACKQILQRDLTEGDMVWESQPAVGGSSAKLKLPNLPGMLGKRIFVGEVSPFKRDTMLGAASSALEAILDSPYGASVNLNKVPEDEERKQQKKIAEKAASASTAGPFSGKGKGKGIKGKWGPDPWQMMMMMMGPWMAAKGKGKGMGMFEGKGMFGKDPWADPSKGSWDMF